MEDHHVPYDTEGIRISDSPRRLPHVTHGLTSPTRSIHAMQIESLHSQADMSMRTADFFEESSEEAIQDADDSIAPDADFNGRRASVAKKRNTASTTDAFVTQCEPKSPSSPVAPGSAFQGYHRLSTEEGQLAQDMMLDAASSSFRGSVDELLPSGQASSPPQLRTTRIASEYTPRSFEPPQRSNQRTLSVPTTKVEQTLGAYAIAHEITLNALMRDEEALSKTLDTFALAPLSAEGRQSLLPHALDPRSPRRAMFSSPATTTTTKKSVQVVPPPIDTSAPRRSIPDNIVRTPYPFPPRSDRNGVLDMSESRPNESGNAQSALETVLTISIARTNASKRVRVTTLTIPATNDFAAVRSSSIGAKERHFKALDFDDAKFFFNLQRCYRELYGRARYFSARSLSRIVISGLPSKTADVRYDWRGSRAIAAKDSKDAFSEEQILRHYRDPVMVRSRYAFVHWAHRMFGSRRIDSVEPTEDRQDEEWRTQSNEGSAPDGLVFILSWSVRRILTALLLLLVASMAATLLWIFLGRNTNDTKLPQGGFRDAGDRVGTGMLVGTCVLLLGLSSIAGWLGISWIII